MSILFEATLSNVGFRTVILLPLSSSKELPSRGMVMIQGTINGFFFKAPLEPDGKESHWFEVSDILRTQAGIIVGQTVSLVIEPINNWIEPVIPDDIMESIMKSGLIDRWKSLTTKARWEWLRWIRSTKNASTRQKRIDVACSKLQKGDKRPCCFDQTRCTLPDVSKSGILLDANK